MSWTFGNVAGPPGPSSQSTANAGPDLHEIQTDFLGFLSIAGNTKLRLLPSPWPAGRLPPTTASLLSVAPKKGLLAAAGPDSLVVASTESVRQAYTANLPTENDVKPFTPQVTLSIPRVSQVAFSADETCLAIAAEEGGGLAVYDTSALLHGRHDPAFQLATNGISVRAMAPNPAPEFSHLFALVLDKGQLVLANLKDRQLVSGVNGPIFKENVSCVSWSAKGKQLVVGLQDGTAAQLDHQGNVKAQLPCPASVSPSMPMTAIYWLANDDFLTVHTPLGTETQDSKINILHRDKASGTFTSRAFPLDPTAPMGQRFPSHHYINRLKGFPPALDDALLLTSSAGLDVGLITRATVPFTTGLPADEVTNTYTLTSVSDDSRRAQIPIASDGVGDSSAIGMIVDLSAKEMVKQPLPSSEVNAESATPLPALMLLDIEGRLTTWWFVYADSIRQKTAYPGLVNVQTQPSPAPASTPFGTSTPASISTPAQSTPAFGSSISGQPNKPAFGAPSTPGFGGLSALGSKPSPWGASSTGQSQSSSVFGNPQWSAPNNAFGAPSATPAFGAASGIASKPSVWGSSTNQTNAPSFGQPSAPSTGTPVQSGFAAFGNTTTSPFAAAASGERSAASPFASFAANNPASSPFAAAASPDTGTDKPSPFAAFGQSSAFDAHATRSVLGSTNTSVFGNPSQTAILTPFSAQPPQDQSSFSPEANMEDQAPESMENSKASLSTPGIGTGAGAGIGTFKLGSIFAEKRDPATTSLDGTAKTNTAKTSSVSFFGSNFGAALGHAADTPATPIKEEPQSPPEGLPAVSMTPATPKASPPTTDAPLPPDFVKTPAKASTGGETDTPELPASSAKPLKSVELEDAPLPPDFAAITRSSTNSQSIAGSPPVDLGAESSELSGSDRADGPAEESEEWEDDEEVDERRRADHGDNDIDDEDEDDDDTALQDDESSTPAVGRRGPPAVSPSTSSKTPAGLPKGPIFAPPVKESPRSPSPDRTTQAPVARPQTRKIALPIKKYSRRSSLTAESQRPAAPQQNEMADLQDDEDERIRAILDAPIEPVKSLEVFVAHQDYVGGEDKQGLGGQIENVYRDINSMIDTLGLNARALQSYIEGHEKLTKSGRTRDDLADEEDWCFVELKDLGRIETEVSDELENGMLTDIKGKTNEIAATHNETLRLKTKMAEMRKQLAARTDPELKAAQRNAAIDAETEAQQAQIRDVVSRVQKLLQETEDALSTLRADLTSAPLDAQGGTLGRRAVPTVEAVTKTILKMTAMVEEKSGDVDVLEAQMRRLYRGLSDLSIDDSIDGAASDSRDYSSSMLRASMSVHNSQSLRRSARGLPASLSMNALATPNRSARYGDRTGMSGMLGSRFFASPSSARTPVLGKSLSVMSLASPLGESISSALFGQSVLSASTNGPGSRRSVADVTEGDVRAYQARREHRMRVLGALKAVVERKGPRVVTVDNREEKH